MPDMASTGVRRAQGIRQRYRHSPAAMRTAGYDCAKRLQVVPGRHRP